jgi:di/tricarboxylate transporter
LGHLRKVLGVFDFHIAITFVIIIVTVVLYATEKWSIESISLTSIAALMLLFSVFPVEMGPDQYFAPERLLSGFSNPALITVIALLVIAQALYQTDALEPVTNGFARIGARSPAMATVFLLLIGGIISAFTNNTPVVVMFLPVVAALATKRHMSPSQVLMPLSFVCILGGMTTLIGSSTNLLVADVAAQYGTLEIGFFDITIPALVLVAVGVFYALVIMPLILKKRKTMAEVMTSSGKQFIAHIDLGHDHKLVGKPAQVGLNEELKDVTVRMIQRGDTHFLPPFENVILHERDRLVVATTRDRLTTLLSKDHSSKIRLSEDENGQPTPRGVMTLVEVVVAPASRLSGRTIQETPLFEEASCMVLGIERRSRMPRGELDQIRLEPGDVLLIAGSRDAVRNLRTNRDVLLMEWSASEMPHKAKAPVARVVFIATIFAAATGLVPIVVAAVTGALAMIAGDCIKIRQAARSIDRRIIMLIGASIAMASALDVTGGAAFLATNMAALMQHMSPAFALSALFLIIAAMTNILSNNATAVLFTPIALGLATELGLNPEPFAVAVILGANCCFATPIGYQTNLLVMGPGHYRFMDFVRAGTPLVILCWLAFSLFAPWYYPL